MPSLITSKTSILYPNLQMKRFDIQVKLLEEYSCKLNGSFLEDFNRTAKDLLFVQSGINHRASNLHSQLMAHLHDLSLDLQGLSESSAELQKACVARTSSALGAQANEISDLTSLEQRLENRVKMSEELKTRSCEAREGFELRERCLREQLAHLKEMRELQKVRLKGKLDSSYRSALLSLKRLRSEFEEARTCEEVATSLAIETERRAAEKCHTVCKKMFQSAENRIRRMETVREKRLAVLRQTLDDLREQTGGSQVSSSDEDPSDLLPSILSAMDDGDNVGSLRHPAESDRSESEALLREPPLMENSRISVIEPETVDCRVEPGRTIAQNEPSSDLETVISGSDHSATLSPPHHL